MVYIIPDPNQEKFMGEMDPEFTFTTRGLLGDDQVWGYLTREEGEDIGNYAFTLDMLETEDYYTLRLPSDAYTFTILPGGASFRCSSMRCFTRYARRLSARTDGPWPWCSTPRMS